MGLSCAFHGIALPVGSRIARTNPAKRSLQHTMRGTRQHGSASCEKPREVLDTHTTHHHRQRFGHRPQDFDRSQGNKHNTQKEQKLAVRRNVITEKLHRSVFKVFFYFKQY